LITLLFSHFSVPFRVTKIIGMEKFSVLVKIFLQVYVDKLVKVAYENWENVVEYDGEALVGVTPYPAVKGMDIHTEDPISAPILSPLPLQSESTSQQSKTYRSPQPALTSVQHRSSTSSTGLYPYHTVPILTGIS
jgi:hypothetical protein